MLLVRKVNQDPPETQARRVRLDPLVQLARKATPDHLGHQEYQEAEMWDLRARLVRLGRQAFRDLQELLEV